MRTNAVSVRGPLSCSKLNTPSLAVSPVAVGDPISQRASCQMYKFIINKNQQPNGDYEVHNESRPCHTMPNPENRIDLGYHESCHGAVREAKRRWPGERINGCAHCCPACHTS